MGKYIPKESQPVDAFQWKPNSRTRVMELLNYLVEKGIDFELFGVRSDRVAILIDEDDQQVRVDPLEYVVFDGSDDHKVIANTTQFYEKYRSIR